MRYRKQTRWLLAVLLLAAVAVAAVRFWPVRRTAFFAFEEPASSGPASLADLPCERMRSQSLDHFRVIFLVCTIWPWQATDLNRRVRETAQGRQWQALPLQRLSGSIAVDAGELKFLTRNQAEQDAAVSKLGATGYGKGSESGSEYRMFIRRKDGLVAQPGDRERLEKELGVEVTRERIHIGLPE